MSVSPYVAERYIHNPCLVSDPNFFALLVLRKSCLSFAEAVVGNETVVASLALALGTHLPCEDHRYDPVELAVVGPAHWVQDRDQAFSKSRHTLGGG